MSTIVINYEYVSKRTNSESMIKEFLKAQTNVYIKSEWDCNRFIEAAVWMSRAGASWRILPAEYGKWATVYRRFARWKQNGVWERMYLHLT